ncbi:hypothetical protein HY792_01880 [Candidatus Desantisbacteria bacterium]|nr:hypothetical protein [Candidatus Desantisbacteria bacterium]
MMIRKGWWLVLLICLSGFSGCIPKGFIIAEDAEDVPISESEGPQLIITALPDPACALEMITVTITSDKSLVSPPTVIITQHYDRKGIDITQSLETTDYLTWQGTYTAKSGYEGSALIEVLNAIDEDGNKGNGTTSFEVVMAEKEEGEATQEEIEQVEYEEVEWYDIRREYGQTGASQAPTLATQKKVSNNINCIVGDDERVWFGTNYGIGQYDRLTQAWKGFFNKKGGMSNSISCILIDDDIVWFGSYGDGLFRYRNSTGKWLPALITNNSLDPNINDILIADNLAWVATDRGLAKYDTLSEQWTFYTLQTTYNQLISEKITKLAWLYPYLWVGTDKGLMSYDLLSDVWQDQTAIYNKNAACLFMDKNDLWIGTPDKGIIQYDTTNNATRTYTISNGLCSNSVLSLKADTGHVFVGHSGGISELDKSNNIWMSFTQVKIGDTPRSLDDVQAVYLEDNGNPWIGMNTGLLDISQSKLMETIKPTIIDLSPAMDAALSTTYPEITAKYEDNVGGSGIDPLAILLWIDGKQVYGTATAQDIYYKSISPLAEGQHNLEIQVADNCGNIATQKNTFSVALPELSYKLLVSQAYIKSGGELSVTIEASEELKGTPTALLSFAEVSILFENVTDKSFSLAPKITENGSETGISAVFGSWTTTDRKKWQGTVMVPTGAMGIGTVTVGFEDVHGRSNQEIADKKVGSVKIVRKDDSGTTILPPQITSIATSTLTGKNIITGTATPGSFVNLMVGSKTVRSVRADSEGKFVFKNVSSTLLNAAGTTTADTNITISATDRSKIISNVSDITITPNLNLLIDFPKIAGTIVSVRVAANESIGTISGWMEYESGMVTNGSVEWPLSITANKSGSMGCYWAGSTNIPPGVDGIGTMTIVAQDTSGKQATFTRMLRIDTVSPGTPSIASTRTPVGGWIIYGTATGAAIVELWGEQRLHGTTTLSINGTFSFRANPNLLPTGTTTLWAVSVDKADNQARSTAIIIYPSLTLFAKMPQPPVGKTLAVYCVANQILGTISGNLLYGSGSVPLSMTVGSEGKGWIGSASIPADVFGIGTVTIFATDIYNQQAEFIGTISIDTIPPGTLTINATYTATAGWRVYGTATDAAIVRLRSKQELYGTMTPQNSNYTFNVDPKLLSTRTTTLWVVSVDEAGNRTESQLLDIPPPLLFVIKMPQLVSKMLEVRGVANQAIGTISGQVFYGNSSMALSIVVGGKNIGWTGSASISAGVDGMGTVTIFATDIYNQSASFIGTLTIDTIPPGTPTVTATYTVTSRNWIVYGTATEAVMGIGMAQPPPQEMVYSPFN